MTAAEMWAEIKKDATKRSPLHVMGLKRRLGESRMDEAGDIKAHITAMQAVWDEIRAIGGKLEDEDINEAVAKIRSFGPK